MDIAKFAEISVRTEDMANFIIKWTAVPGYLKMTKNGKTRTRALRVPLSKEPDLTTANQKSNHNVEIYCVSAQARH